MKTQKDSSKNEPAIDIPIEQHRENLKREGENLRTALDSATAIASRTETAAAAEREAKEKLAQHAAVSGEAKVIQADWSKLVADLAILKERLARGREQSRFCKEHFEKRSQHLRGYWGGGGSNLEFLQCAQQISAIGSTIPFAESAVKHIEDLVCEHLKAMRDFGKLHGLPQEVLARLAYTP
jgi:hypothetical protein